MIAGDENQAKVHIFHYYLIEFGSTYVAAEKSSHSGNTGSLEGLNPKDLYFAVPSVFSVSLLPFISSSVSPSIAFFVSSLKPPYVTLRLNAPCSV